MDSVEDQKHFRRSDGALRWHRWRKARGRRAPVAHRHCQAGLGAVAGVNEKRSGQACLCIHHSAWEQARRARIDRDSVRNGRVPSADSEHGDVRIHAGKANLFVRGGLNMDMRTCLGVGEIKVGSNSACPSIEGKHLGDSRHGLPIKSDMNVLHCLGAVLRRSDIIAVGPEIEASFRPIDTPPVTTTSSIAASTFDRCSTGLARAASQAPPCDLGAIRAAEVHC